MLILASTLKRCPIIAPGTGKLGELGQLIIDGHNGQILGFCLHRQFPFGPQKIISMVDIIAIDRRVVVINNPDSIVASDEVIRIHKVMKEGLRLLSAKAVTENGQYLGKVYDLLICNEPPIVVRYYMRHYVKNRILPAEKVVRITKKAIVFSDDVMNIPAAPEGAMA